MKFSNDEMVIDSSADDRRAIARQVLAFQAIMASRRVATGRVLERLQKRTA